MLIHALAAATPGVQIANPRQCAPHRYSRKFGPLPPCFARATRVHCADGQSFLLIGGTASIRGEESQHLSELENQLAETRTNLISLLGAATGQSPAPRLLNCLDQLRVYYPNARHLPEIRQSVESWFPNPDRIEWGQADLCRAELLVEIEGRANLILPESIQPA
jgi:chorismate lyase/3-hydroxybenzoate synthase